MNYSNSLIKNVIKVNLLWVFMLLFMQGELNAQQANFTYNLSKNDYAILPISVLINYGSSALRNNRDFNLTIEEIRNLDKNDILFFDRSATKNWNTELNNASDIFVLAFSLLPGCVMIPQVFNLEFRNIATYSVMYLEVIFLTRGATSLAKYLAQRTRPYLYNNAFTPEERFGFQENEASEANTSFFSGHTSQAFASAVFLSKTYTDLYGKNVWSKVIWAGSLSAAAFTGYCRVEAGEHFITDVITGAAVGSAIGYFIPVLHKKTPTNLSYLVLPNQISFTLRF